MVLTSSYDGMIGSGVVVVERMGRLGYELGNSAIRVGQLVCKRVYQGNVLIFLTFLRWCCCPFLL